MITARSVNRSTVDDNRARCQCATIISSTDTCCIITARSVNRSTVDGNCAHCQCTIIVSCTDACCAYTARSVYDTSINHDIARRNIVTAPDASSKAVAACVEFSFTADGQRLAFWDMDTRVN